MFLDRMGKYEPDCAIFLPVAKPAGLWMANITVLKTFGQSDLVIKLYLISYSSN